MNQHQPSPAARLPRCGECGHVRALNWETCLPVPQWRHVTAMPQPTANQPAILDCGGKRSATPLSPAPATPRTLLRHWLLGVVAVRKDCWMLDVGCWMLDVSHFSQSRQKPQQSRQIKANQGKHQIRESSRWMGRTGRRMPNRVPRKNPLLGERKQVREDVPPTGQAASSCLSDPGHPDLRNPRPVPDFPLQSCLIKPNQAIR